MSLPCLSTSKTFFTLHFFIRGLPFSFFFERLNLLKQNSIFQLKIKLLNILNNLKINYDQIFWSNLLMIFLIKLIICKNVYPCNHGNFKA